MEQLDPIEQRSRLRCIKCETIIGDLTEKEDGYSVDTQIFKDLFWISKDGNGSPFNCPNCKSSIDIDKEGSILGQLKLL